ncbi:hypothetical protein [Streptomyces griseorubiginosus]|uniref:hypothetical protein n=1 Tax=Streptomyces griseorubiginosus TaxID=67304 RepID=UPI003323DF76
MFRVVAWIVLALFLLVVGAWPAAAAPVALAFAGAGVVASKIPGMVLLGIAAIAWLRHRPTPAPVKH